MLDAGATEMNKTEVTPTLMAFTNGQTGVKLGAMKFHWGRPYPFPEGPGKVSWSQ